MSKLPESKRFLDLSDYGRPIAKWLANALKDTQVNAIHVTITFIISGLLAVASILNEHYWLALFFLIGKSILDAADGELSRVKNEPSYVGRYFDSVADIILNFLILLAICHVCEGSLLYTILAFIGIQLQGTLYNYYYVILRNKLRGDTTSRIFEDEPPKAFPGESQAAVNRWFYLFYFCYALFDKTIHRLDPQAVHGKPFPSWFMTMVSALGLGFQLLLIGIMLALGLIDFVIPFFIGYTLVVAILVGVRRMHFDTI